MGLPRRQFLTTSLAFALGACAASTTRNPSDSRQLSFWTMQLAPTFSDYIGETIAAFEAAHPGVAVSWVDVPWGEMESKILTAIAARTAPDIANLNPQFATKLAERNTLANLDRLIPAGAREHYFPNLWQANQLGETTFGLPWYASTDVTFYNRALFEAAGLDPDRPPQTYAELAVVAAVVKDRTGKYAFMPTMDGAQVLEAMVQMGLVVLTPDGGAGFDTPEGRAAFRYWVELFQQEAIPREVLTESHRRAIELYQAGELALLLTGPQLLRQVAENAPEIAAVTDVSSQISGPSGVKSASVMNVVVPRQSANVGLAIEFALFLTNGDNQLAFAQLANILPSTIASASAPYFTQEDGTAIARARAVSARQLPEAEVLIPPVAGLDDLRTIVYEELQLAMLGQKDTDDAVTDAASRWNLR